MAAQLAGRSLTCWSIGEGCTRAVGFLSCREQGSAMVLVLRWEGTDCRIGESLTSCDWCGLCLGVRSTPRSAAGLSNGQALLVWLGAEKSQGRESGQGCSSTGRQLCLVVVHASIVNI